MRIKEVIYQRLFTFGWYSNERIGFVAEIGPDEDPGQVLLQLAEFTVDVHHVLDILRAIHDRLDYATLREDKELAEGLLRDLAEIRKLIREGKLKVVIEKYADKYKRGD